MLKGPKVVEGASGVYAPGGSDLATDSSSVAGGQVLALTSLVPADPAAVRSLPLAQVAAACRDQTSRFRRGQPADTVYCLELFRRAVCERQDDAWQAILDQYGGLVLSWVRLHGAAAGMQEDETYWVNRTFDRFWSAVGPDRFDLFGRLPALLKYLKLCVHSVVMDEARLRQSEAARAVPAGEELPSGGMAEVATDDPETTALANLTAGELWSAIAAVCAGEAEREVVYRSLVLDVKPQEIRAGRPELFATVADVYRIKRNVLDRLKRSPAILSFVR